MASGKKIEIYPFGDAREAFLDELAGGLAAFFKTPVKVGQKIKLPAGSFDLHRGQYRSEMFLAALADLRQERESDSGRQSLLLGVTGKDLYLPQLNYIFGEAGTGGVAVITYCRLKPEFYGNGADPLLLQERILKEAVHEIGHLLGMRHCENPGCIMHFSTMIRDTDFKGPGFCGQCQARFQRLDFNDGAAP